MTTNTTLIRTFALVTKHQSATAAGHILGISAQTARRQIEALERREGKLFYRPGFSRLTLDGRELLEELTK